MIKQSQKLLLVCLLIVGIPIIFSPFSKAEQGFRKRINQISQDGYRAVDIEAEINFGRELAAKILATYPLDKSETLQEYVSLLGQGISQQFGRAELNYYFAVIDTGDINAYAAPGGYIFITSTAIKNMRDEAQLVGVLAHEIVHVNKRHVVKQLKIKGDDKSMTSGLAMIAGGATTGARAAFQLLTDKAFKMLFEEGLAKKDEFEADSIAIEIMTGLGYSWESYRSYLQNLGELIAKGKGKVVSKTHPSVNSRISGINQIIKEQNLANIKGKINEKRFSEYLSKI